MAFQSYGQDNPWALRTLRRLTEENEALRKKVKMLQKENAELHQEIGPPALCAEGGDPIVTEGGEVIFLDGPEGFN